MTKSSEAERESVEDETFQNQILNFDLDDDGRKYEPSYRSNYQEEKINE